MVSKKTSGIVICLLSENVQVKWPHCIHLADENGVKKNERKCYLFALGIWKSQNDARASPRRYKTVQNGFQKNERFQKIKFPHHTCFHFWKTWKKALMLVFFGPFTRFFALFKNVQNRKKSEKWPKNRVFSSFSLCSAALFLIFPRYTLCLYFYILDFKIKTQKKLKNIFWNFFFKTKIGHLFLSIFQILKKVSKK